MSFKQPFLRNKKITKPRTDFNVQLIEYYNSDGDIDFDMGKTHKYEICMFGITEKSETVCIRVNDYKPFFYIEVPNSFKTRYNKVINDNDFDPEDDEDDLVKFVNFLRNQKYKVNGVEKKFWYALKDAEFSLLRSFKCDGFQKNKTKFLKIEFNSLFGFHKLKTHLIKNYIVRKKKLFFDKRAWFPRLYESDLVPLIKFFHDKNINTCGWINVKNNEFIGPDDKERKSICQYECIVSKNDIMTIEREDIGPMTIASYDIECTSGDGSFPSSDREDDKIIQIGTTFERYKDEEKTYYNNIITLGGCDDIKDADVISCETELDVLIAWCNLIRDTDPDIVTGYNINGFDFKYIFNRIEFLLKNKKEEEKEHYRDLTLSYGRLKKRCGIKSQLLQSSALGQSELFYIIMEGRINIDLLSYARREFKLESYKLDNVAKKFIGSQKNDVSPNMIFKLQKGSDSDRKIIAEYCIQDCKLVNKLLTKLSVIPNNFGMASTCYIPNNYILFRGQGIKGHSLVIKYASQLGYIIPSSKLDKGNSDYKGATVIEPKIGSHFYPVSCLDFASLYPSCMISHNLCITSIITDKKDLDIPGRTYKSITWERDDGSEAKYTYIQPENDKNGTPVRGLIPTILQTLLKKRKDTRKRQKEVAKTDPFRASILNGLQLSYKTTANSIYGLLGATTSAFCRPEIAASITTTGRALLDIASSRVMKHFPNSKLIYGDTDSVFMKFELKRHSKECKFHKTKMDERFKAFDFFVKKYRNEMQERLNNGEKIDIKHSIEETSMQNCKFQLYKKCDCPLIEDEMSKEALQQSIDMGFEAEKIFDTLLPHPHKLEYEKTYQPYISFAKKRYIGYLYETDVNKQKLDYKGIVLKRRDNAQIVKKFYSKAIDLILAKKFDEALENIDKDLEEMFGGKMDINLFQITKTLKTLNSYKISFMKKKFYIEDAFSFIKLLILYGNKINIEENRKIIEYIKEGDLYLDYTRNNKLDLYNFVLDNNEIKEKLRTIDFKKLEKHTVQKKTISVGELLELFETCDIDKTKFKIDKYSDIEGNIKISKFLKKYNDKIRLMIVEKIPQSHVALNEKIKKRDPGSAFESNDRIPYCFIFKKHKKGKKVLQSDIVEIPSYIKENDIHLDYLYYLEKQLMKPLTQLFEMIECEDKLKEIFQKYIVSFNNKKNGIVELI